MAIGDIITRKGFSLSVKVKNLVITVTGASGTFAYGETVTGGTSSAAGKVIYYDTSNSEVIVNVTSGTFADAETITGGTSSATATTSGVPAVGWGSGWVAMARVRDSFSVSRSRSSTPIEDFDTDEEDFVDNIRGIQSGDASFTQTLVPGGASYQQVEAAMDYNLAIALKRVQTDRDEANTRTRYYLGGVTGFNESDSVNDVSTVAATFTLDDVSQADPTAA